MVVDMCIKSPFALAWLPAALRPAVTPRRPLRPEVIPWRPLRPEVFLGRPLRPEVIAGRPLRARPDALPNNQQAIAERPG